MISNKSKCQNPVVLNRFGLYWFINAKSQRTRSLCSVIVEHLNLGVLSIAFLIVHCIHCWCLRRHHHQACFNRSSHPESRSKSVMKNGSFPLSQPLVAELGAVSDGVISAKWPLISGVGLLLRGFTSIETFPSSKHPLIIIIFRTCDDPLSAATCVSTSLFINTFGGTLKSRKYQFEISRPFLSLCGLI